MTADPHIEAHNDDTGDAADLLRYYRDGMDTYRQSSIEQTNKADALAARLEAAEARATEAERVIVELRKHHDDLSAERGVAVARLAADEPGRNDMSDPAYELSQRGFKYLAPITCTYGTEVRVYESSAAESPHLWVALKETKLEGRGEAHAHLSFEQARELRDQLDWLLDNHYQVAAAPPPAASGKTSHGLNAVRSGVGSFAPGWEGEH